MVRMRCGMGVSDALTLWKWRITFVVEWTLLLANRMESLHRGCCSLDCDLLWCWINRWIRLWKEMICWFCRLFLLSSDNLSVGEESCESIIPWFLDPNSFRSILYHLHRLALEYHNCNHHHSFPFSSNLIQSIASFPSTQLFPIHHSDPSLIESTYFDTCFPSIHHSVIHFDVQPHAQINCSELEWMPFLFHSYSLSLFYSHHQIPTTGSRICDHWIITYLAMGKTYITPNYCYSNKQVLSHSIHLRIIFP